MPYVRVSVLGLTLAALLWPLPGGAIPLFAHQYGVTCRKCHTVIPHLTQFGDAFMASGDRIPGVQPGDAIPFAFKVNLVDSSENQGPGPNGEGLPKEIVDEVELFTAGAIGTRGSFYVEKYAVDGGFPGRIREMWFNDRVNPWSSRIPVYVQAGSFTLSLPVDPETFRESYQDYAPYVQTVGNNPFDFFDPHVGFRVSVGNPLAGLNVQLFAGPGHDPGSDLRTVGTDTMEFVQQTMGFLAPSFFHYEGTRPTGLGMLDQFQRTGWGLVYNDFAKWESDAVVMTGWDSNCEAPPGAGGCASSGGFEQLRYAPSPRFFVLGRYEGTYDTIGGLQRDGVLMAGYGSSENSRVTIEDVIAHTPLTSNTMNAQFTIGY
ncbi:MAG TPA: hypothetical protein VMF61_04505 [Candidatus Acidoferrales bacterium]|nr:hypothetical protein [Candidatus Acidoferrales bacterium]